jgi:hypothetical protein
MKTSNFNIGSIVCKEQNRAVVFVVWVENFGAGEAVPPCLAVTVDEAFSIYLNVPMLLLAQVFYSNEKFITYFPPQTMKVMLFWKS